MKILRTLLFFCLLLPATLRSYEYELSVATIFQNEAPYFREWIEFNRLQGVEHFYLYNNESKDNFQEVLQPYIDQGIVELYDWPNLWPDILFHRKCQLMGLNDALEKSRSHTKWLAFIDVDEYVFPTNEGTLIEYLRQHCEEVSGICINWQCYGTSRKILQPGELLTENLHLKAIPGHKKNLDYKSIVRPDDVAYCPNQHYCDFVPGKYAVNEHGEVVTPGMKWSSVEKIRINHYWLKDEGFFWAFKAPRLRKRGYSDARIEEILQDFNVVEDRSISRFIHLLKQRLSQ